MAHYQPIVYKIFSSSMRSENIQKDFLSFFDFCSYTRRILFANISDTFLKDPPSL
jgi:hypothetical protein